MVHTVYVHVSLVKFSAWFALSNMISAVQVDVSKREGYFFQCLTAIYKPLGYMLYIKP